MYTYTHIEFFFLSFMFLVWEDVFATTVLQEVVFIGNHLLLQNQARTFV